jgi:multiple sugar transport system ATP-binding protein
VRPEQIEVRPAADGAAGLKLSVSVVEPMGADTLVWGTVGKETVSVRVDPDTTFHVGETADVSFQPAVVSLFDAESGTRL